MTAADEGISGTNIKRRDGFNGMIQDVLDGKTDLIVSKPVSRFARNTVDEENVRRTFITAYNQLMRDRSQIVAGCELMRRALVNLAELDAEIERQQEETKVVAELVKAAVQENAFTAQSQDPYLQKYEALTFGFYNGSEICVEAWLQKSCRVRFAL